ncbi:hypothetical protein N7474_003663 [Penicillium riverlandense]|uniref:uncharacterized protein n=1 Tax=Penicillium riverlandense TaxID=1903569 RepID=UPI0025474F03|nr:uncharacterized protein N7474_003663 [Penicillium riverlandense]KAJ5818072.1 hypothetical protein N7474_003663 [Penicillium riverlandense]
MWRTSISTGILAVVWTSRRPSFLLCPVPYTALALFNIVTTLTPVWPTPFCFPFELTNSIIVTFSYTAAFWNWEEWETQLDWMALRGINLPLAWVGQEKILVEVFREIGLTDAEIATYLSGPAFQAWNRFGNIQGSWHGNLPQTWIDQQFDLQKKIVHRMVQLGMTPVLPAFTGFVPMNITRVLPDASVVRGSQWNDFPAQYTNDSFLEPSDPHFAKLQRSFITKQKAAYGDISHVYTLDQYNENNPYSGNEDYLRNVTSNTLKSLKAADPEAIWMMQGWLFVNNADFWTDSRIKAYLSGVEDNKDMLILDLFSESSPQWQRTDSYYGKPWIWCQLHDFGGSQGLYGQIRNITQNATQARIESPTMVGYGLSPEGQEGNEIVYDILLDQAWSQTPLDTKQYFHNWVTSRYAGEKSVPQELYEAWEILRTTVYDNTNLTSALAVTKSIIELRPSIEGLIGVASGTTINYKPSELVQAGELMYRAAAAEPGLWTNPSYKYDMIDVTRQVMANHFVTMYNQLLSTYEGPTSNSSKAALSQEGQAIVRFLTDYDAVLQTDRNYRFSTWIDAARSWAQGNNKTASFLEYNARNQITLWGPRGEITDYASKAWGGLVSSYYIPRWRTFIEYLQTTPSKSYNDQMLNALLMDLELNWQMEKWDDPEPTGDAVDLKKVLATVRHHWPAVFAAN